MPAITPILNLPERRGSKRANPRSIAAVRTECEGSAVTSLGEYRAGVLAGVYRLVFEVPEGEESTRLKSALEKQIDDIEILGRAEILRLVEHNEVEGVLSGVPVKEDLQRRVRYFV